MRSERATMRERFKQFSRELHEAKTLLLELGRFAPTRRARCGQGKPQTFKLLGFLFICCKTRRGAYQVINGVRSLICSPPPPPPPRPNPLHARAPPVG